MSETMLAMLREEYLTAQDEKKIKRREIQERHREAIAQEVAVMEDSLDTRLGEMLVRALGSGLKRMEIWKPVFGTNDNKRWSRLVELGGGNSRVRRTSSEIIAEARTVRENSGRYAKQLVTNEDSDIGKGLLVTAFEGITFPEPLNLPIYKISMDGLEYQVRDLPYEKRPDGENMPSWWTDITHVPGEYKRFAVEANEFIIAEIGV